MDNFFNIKIVKKEKKQNCDRNKDFLISYNKSNILNDDKYIVNLNIFQKIKNLSKNPMNLYVHGNKGVGKNVIVQYYVNKILGYQPNLQENTFISDTKELNYYNSKNYKEIIVNKYNFNDINLIIKLLKNILNENYNSFSNTKNIVVIKNIEIIRYENIKYLKNIIEKYYNNNLFIFISKKDIPDILKGFFLNLRVPKPKKQELDKLIIYICKIKNFNINEEQINYINKLSDGSLSKLINIIELSYLDGSYEKYEDIDIKKFKFIIKILKKKKMDNLFILRDLINELIIDNILPNEILKRLTELFIMENTNNKLDNLKMYKIINKISVCDKNISLSLREIHHLEYLFVQIMNIL